MEVTIALCKQVMKYYGATEDLHGLYMAMCMLNAVFSVTAIAENSLLLLALRKSTSLPSTSRILLQNLSFSDVCVGLLVHPLYIVVISQVMQNYGCEHIHKTVTGFFIISSILSAVSYLTVISVGMDRYFAISLHLRYQELVTPRRAFAFVIGIWAFVLIVVQTIFFTDIEFGELVVLLSGFTSMFLLSFIYVKIYKIARHHQAIIDIQVQVTAEMQTANHTVIQNRNLAMKTFYVFVVFVLCYSPYLVTLTTMVALGANVMLQGTIQLATVLLLFNSSLNPVIFGWKMKEIRLIITDELRALLVRRYTE